MRRDGDTGLPAFGSCNVLLTEGGSSLPDFTYNSFLYHPLVRGPHTLIFIKSVFHNETMLLALDHGGGEENGVGVGIPVVPQTGHIAGDCCLLSGP